jgi:hypothetical protein
VAGDGGAGPGRAGRLGEVTDAGLTTFAGGDQGDQPQPGGVGQGFEQSGQLGGLDGGDRFAQKRRAARIGQQEGGRFPAAVEMVT